MMDSQPETAEAAIQAAIEALNRQDRTSARRLAQQAAALAPLQEMPWLILAAISDGQAAQSYLEQALIINPSSTQAQAGLAWLQKKLAAAPAPGIEDTQKVDVPPLPAPAPAPAGEDMASIVQPAVSNGKFKKSGVMTAAGGALALLFAVLLLASGGWFFYHIYGVRAESMTVKYNPQWVDSISAEDLTVTSTPAALRSYMIPATPSVTPTPTITPRHTLSPTPTQAPTLPLPVTFAPLGRKRIEVVISQQRVFAYQGSQVVYEFTASTGMGNDTPTGQFTILDKEPNAYSRSFNFWMPSWMGFAWMGGLEDGFHALPLLANGTQVWGDRLGRPGSYGCVVMGPNEAKLLYSWADVGTQVTIRQ